MVRLRQIQLPLINAFVNREIEFGTFNFENNSREQTVTVL